MATTEAVVVGASGFGRECLDVLEAMMAAGTDIKIIGVVDDSPSDMNLRLLSARHVKYLGSVTDWLEDRENERYVMGIGNPEVRRKVVATLDIAGATAMTLVHPSVTFGAQTVPTEGLVACAGVTISNNVKFGRHVHINPNATIGHDAELRDFVSINPAAVISGNVLVDAGTLVGAAATILQGISVGERTVVGAGSVVTKNVPVDVVVKGVPGVWK